MADGVEVPVFDLLQPGAVSFVLGSSQGGGFEQQVEMIRLFGREVMPAFR